MQQQLSDEPLQGGEAAGAVAGPYGQRARVTPERLAFVIKEQWKTFNQVIWGAEETGGGGGVRRVDRTRLPTAVGGSGRGGNRGGIDVYQMR